MSKLRSACLAVHRLVRVSVSVRVKFRVTVRDMVKLQVMDQGDVTVSIMIMVS